MNAGVKFLLILIVSLEISFTLNFWVNVSIIIVSGFYLIYSRLSWQRYALLLLLPILPALGAWTSFTMHSTTENGEQLAAIMITRIIAYIWLGAAFSFTTNMSSFLDTLEQKCYTPTTFIYGLRGALSFMPHIRQEIKTMQQAARMRGIILRSYSPQLLFKAILISLQWAERLSTAMISHGFTENEERTHFLTVHINKRDWLFAFCLLFTLQMIYIFS